MDKYWCVDHGGKSSLESAKRRRSSPSYAEARLYCEFEYPAEASAANDEPGAVAVGMSWKLDPNKIRRSTGDEPR